MKSFTLYLVLILATGLTFTSFLGCSKDNPTGPTDPIVASPVILTQPVSQTVVSPNPATFSIVATGATAYQWQTLVSGSWVNVVGATSSSYTITSTDFGQSGMQIRCQASNSGGSVASATVTLAVNLGMGSPYLGGTIILMPTASDSGLVAANSDQPRGIPTTYEEAVAACAAYGPGGYVIPDTTQLWVMLAAKNAGILTGFADPNFNPMGAYLSSTFMLNHPEYVFGHGFNDGRRGWFVRNSGICVRGVRRFKI